jgi:hypothetical protein
VITYLKLTGLPRGLLINFNVPVLARGVKSFVRPKAPRDDAQAPEPMESPDAMS